MPYPPLSSSSPQSPGGPFGLQPWHSLRSQGPRQAQTLASSSQAPKLVLLHESLELLLHLAHLCLLFLPLGALLGRFVFASDNACLRFAASVVAPTIAALILSLFAIAPFTYFNKVFLTFLLLELLRGTPELLLGLLEALLQHVHFRSEYGGRQQRSMHTHIDSFC